MAIFSAGSLVGTISGKVGGVVFRRARVGGVLCARPVTVNARTGAQLDARASRARLVAAWRALPENYRQAWRVFARLRRSTNRLGVVRALSGFQSYCSYAGVVYGGDPPADLGPPASAFTVAPSFVASAWFAGGPLAVNSWGDPWPDDAVTRVVYAQRFAAPAGVSPHRQIVRVGALDQDYATQDFAGEASELAASLVPGERVLVGARWYGAGGWPGPVIWSASVVDDVPVEIDYFERAVLGPYDGDTTFFGIVGSPVYEGDGALACTIPAGSTQTVAIYTVDGLNFFPFRGSEFSVRFRMAAANERIAFWFGVQDSSNYYMVRQFADSDQFGLVRVASGGGVPIDTVGGVSAPLNEWLLATVTWGPGATMSATLHDEGGSLLASVSGSDATWDGGGVGYRLTNAAAAQMSAYWDTVKIIGAA